jgi:putative oxidoreductase
MEAFGVPGILVWPAAALEIVGGVMLLAGFKVRLVGAVFSFWCLLTAAIFHTKFSDQVQQIMFMKNLAMAGGFLMLAKTGSDQMSVDGRTS